MIIEVTHNTHLINGLRVKILIDINVLTPYKIVLDFDSKKLLINIYFFETDIDVYHKDTRIAKKIKIAKYIIIPPYSIIEVPVKYSLLPKNREYFFEPALISVFAYIVDTLSFV